MDLAQRPRSILDSLGSDIIGVMSPVSICMFLVVVLVSVLSPPATTSPDLARPAPPPVPTAATLVYQESPSDPTSKKLEGALLNAIAFVALIAAVTFLLLILYYYNFTGFLRNYMRFSAFFVLASMGGSIIVELLRRFSVPLDAATFGITLLNFSAVGVLAVLAASGIPIVVRQGYMVSLGIIVATWFTKLPEWTTWTVLMALAVYDLVAVLAPGGPLKLLVELASTRDEELPALIYEARPTVVPSTTSNSAMGGSLELQPVSDNSRLPAVAIVNLEAEIAESSYPSSSAVVEIETVAADSESSPLVQASARNQASGTVGSGDPLMTSEREASTSFLDDNVEVFDTTRGIKLGLGDFVFYSVLVGRAAMYDWMTVYACYLAIISGLGCTLILLSVYRKALPALPISITLGVGFYFLTRLLMEPFVVGVSSNLVMF